MNNLVAAEWLKLRSTRVLHGVVPAAVLVSFAAVAGSALAADRAGIALASTRGLQRVLPTTGVGAVIVLIVGILISAGEHRHGTAGDTFLTTPVRRRVVTAKLILGGLVGLSVGAVTAAACAGAAAVLYKVLGTALPIGDSEVWLTLAGTLLYSALFAVLGVAVGTLVRNQVLAVAGALAWIAIVEHVLVNLAPAVGKWLPAAAGQAIVRTPLEGLLSPSGGVALLVAYAAAITAAGVRFTVARDV